MTELNGVWCDVESPIGRLRLVVRDGALVRLAFDSERVELGGAVEDPTDPVLAQAARQLGEYFAGERTDFDVPLSLAGSPFERAAWQVLTTIPFGETMSYGAQAAAADRPGGAQAVGAANGRNPIAVIVPCHRVVGTDGSMVGFGGGIPLKRWLLDHESGTQRLF